ncbi:MAG: cation:proton antiporter subunit C [Spirochaetia bacterium]|jgi:multicomponent Na+:H+ antiporter subunit C|nr:cation:proton antiporter subunit C [Spirochaetia bacterium]
MTNLILIAALFIVGVCGLILAKNLVKKVIALGIINSTVIILFIYTGSFSGDLAPIILSGMENIVDPVPQALMLTAIVVGLCITALALALIYRLFQLYGSLDISEIEKKAKHL